MSKLEYETSPGDPILVTGAAGRVGGVGGLIVEALRRRDLPVRALVRRDDERADALRTKAQGSSSPTSPVRVTSCAPWRAASACTSA